MFGDNACTNSSSFNILKNNFSLSFIASIMLSLLSKSSTAFFFWFSFNYSLKMSSIWSRIWDFKWNRDSLCCNQRLWCCFQLPFCSFGIYSFQDSFFYSFWDRCSPEIDRYKWKSKKVFFVVHESSVLNYKTAVFELFFILISLLILFQNIYWFSFEYCKWAICCLLGEPSAAYWSNWPWKI